MPALSFSGFSASLHYSLPLSWPAAFPVLHSSYLSTLFSHILAPPPTPSFGLPALPLCCVVFLASIFLLLLSPSIRNVTTVSDLVLCLLLRLLLFILFLVLAVIEASVQTLAKVSSNVSPFHYSLLTLEVKGAQVYQTWAPKPSCSEAKRGLKMTMTCTSSVGSRCLPQALFCKSTKVMPQPSW